MTYAELRAKIRDEARAIRPARIKPQPRTVCDCGACRKCRHRTRMRRYRDPWVRSVRLFARSHLGYPRCPLLRVV